MKCLLRTPIAGRYTPDMSRNARCRIALLVCLIAAGFFFFSGIRWGLPSKRIDPLLFGSEPVWNGQKILQLSGGWKGSGGGGAELDANPLTGRDRAIVLNETDTQRAQILLRYRLYSYQPDEMLTFRALAAMNPSKGQLDPRGYQYGGLWIYGVGAMLKAASLCKWIIIKPDVAYYLDQPEEFGKFYIVARFYSAAWGMVGVWAVFNLVRRWVGGWRAPAVASLCFACLPAVVTMAHEAKPHLPGAVLTLLAVLCGDAYARRGKLHWAIAAGAICGAAVAMVPTALWSFALLPLMTVFRPISWGRRAAIGCGAAAVGVLVYAATNPYVLIHLLRGENVVAASAANTASFYHERDVFKGALHTFSVIREGTSWMLLLGGAAVVLIRLAVHVRALREKKLRSRRLRFRPLPWLLAAPVALTLVQLAVFGAGKKMEYGRFAILPDVAIVIAAVVGLARWARAVADPRFTLLYVTLLLSAMAAGARYLQKFVQDAQPVTSRMAEGQRLALGAGRIPLSIALVDEPAPYCLPPVNLFDWRLTLLPRGQQTSDADVLIRAVDDPAREPPVAPGAFLLPPARPGAVTPISWAAKPFRIEMHSPPPLAPTTANGR